MNGMYRRKRCARRSRVLTVLAVSLLTTGAFAAIEKPWLDGCVGGLDCLFDFCWCEGDWDDPDNWASGIPSGNEIAKFNRSNFPASCPIGTTEGWLQVNLTTTHSFGALLIQTELTMQTSSPGGGGTDQLRLAFTGSGTLDTSGVQLDATSGPITLEVKDGARIATQ